MRLFIQTLIFCLFIGGIVGVGADRSAAVGVPGVDALLKEEEDDLLERLGDDSGLVEEVLSGYADSCLDRLRLGSPSGVGESGSRLGKGKIARALPGELASGWWDRGRKGSGVFPRLEAEYYLDGLLGGRKGDCSFSFK